VHARLLNRSRKTGEDFQFILQRYAAERFLFRLGQSKYRDRYVLKGAMLFALWGGSVYRPTRDLDFTGYGDDGAEAVLAGLAEICSLTAADDGLYLDSSTLTAEPIREEAEYNGLRVRLQARLGNARIPMQIDIGFGNAIEPQPHDVDYPTLLDDASPHIRAYPPEAVVAEKLHTLVVLGDGNSRMKDLYDLYVIAGQFDFDGETLTRAIQATFERRRTDIVTALPAGLAPRFFADDTRSERWRAYCDRNTLPGAPRNMQQVGERLRSFLGPVWRALADKDQALGQWRAGGPWHTGGERP
jgi:predicted nucleotidyltransferase component of viral defense system